MRLARRLILDELFDLLLCKRLRAVTSPDRDQEKTGLNLKVAYNQWFARDLDNSF